jgi:hypothetical protein
MQAVLNVLKEEAIDKSGGKLGGRELLDLIIRKWGVAYDIQLRKNKVDLFSHSRDILNQNSYYHSPTTAIRRWISQHIYQRHVEILWTEIFSHG